MGRRVLDEKLMQKLADRIQKSVPAVAVMVSKYASKNGISAESALVLIAKSNHIGAATFQRRLDPSKQQEIREVLAKGQPAPPLVTSTPKPPAPKRPSKRSMAALAIDALIQDPVLRARCRDILMAPSHFDRPINQATQVLEDRIRSKASPEKRLTGENLVAYAFNEDLAKSRLHVASGDPDDQRGFTQILRGIVPAFRNITHHHLVDHFSREDAMRVCGFIDVLLRIVDSAENQQDAKG